MEEFNFKLLKQECLADILLLTCVLNSEIKVRVLENRQVEMFEFENYRCFGIYKKEKLLGVASGWITVKLYSGKQLEIVNVIIDLTNQSKGLGSRFMEFIENWASNYDCNTVELNSFAQNNRSHKFYFNKGYHILGFHFQKHV